MNMTIKISLAASLIFGSIATNVLAQKSGTRAWSGSYTNGPVTYNLFSDNSYYVKNGNFFQSGSYKGGSNSNEIVLSPSGQVLKKEGANLIKKDTKEQFSKGVNNIGLGADNTGVTINSRLLGGKWLLTEINGKAVKTTEGRKEPFLAFKAEDGSFYGNGGCNGFGGKVLQNTDFKIEFGDAIQTMMACIGAMEVESALHKALRTADNYTIKNGVMSLNKARMAPLAKFKFVKD